MNKVAEIFESMEYGPAPESDGPAREWLRAHEHRFELLIAGKWQPPNTKEWFQTVDPATSEVLAEIARADTYDVDAAVKAARAAQPSWEALGCHGRARHLYAIARAIQRHARLLAVLETLDNGKSIRETRDIDVPLVIRHFYHHAGWAQLRDDEFPDQKPVGVVGQVIPWNFPLLMLAWKIAPALAAGNTIVLKPAELTSLTALLFGELCIAVGLPAGVVNIVTGEGNTGAALTTHPDVDKIAFTGSTEVGRIIRRATAGSGKHLTLELGGKSPFMVFDDADLDSAVEGVVDAIWFNQGQVCCAGSRLLVQESVAERFHAKLRARMDTLRVGSPLDKCVDMGAIVDRTQLARINELVEVGVKEGATKYQSSTPLPSGGCFFPPTLLVGVQPASTVAREEIFGPVLVSMTFRTPDEAVELANNTVYGLAASVWTENINLALEVAPRIRAGVVWVNSTNLFDASCGFGGYRESGFGREGGAEGMYAYLEPKFVESLPTYETPPPLPAPKEAAAGAMRAIDRTPKLYIAGKQVRPDGNYSRGVLAPDGTVLGEVGEGSRKDVRDAVEAASKAVAWSGRTSHGKAQVLYYVAENLEARRAEFVDRIVAMTGSTLTAASAEVDASVARIFAYAAWSDKFEGRVHLPPIKDMTVALPEAIGNLAVVCPDEAPLLAFVSLVMPALAMGNRVIAIPSERHPLAATDFYQVLDTSDVPDGVINIVTGDRDALARVLAEHDDVDAIWYFGPLAAGSATVEAASIGNMKQTWVNDGRRRDWFDRTQAEGREFLRRATQIKNVWVPYGE